MFVRIYSPAAGARVAAVAPKRESRSGRGMDKNRALCTRVAPRHVARFMSFVYIIYDRSANEGAYLII